MLMSILVITGPNYDFHLVVFFLSLQKFTYILLHLHTLLIYIHGHGG